MIGHRLVQGDTIGIITPASGEKTNSMDKNIEQLQQLGFKIKEGKYLRKCSEYLAGDDKERAYDLLEMFNDKNIKGIICYRGGYGSIRMMQYLDWKIIKKNPKIFCGYSDITILLNNITSITNLITFHSPMVNSNFSNELTREYFLNMLMNPCSTFDINLKNFPQIKIYNKKNIKGKLCGGNLSMICSSIGTPYEINTKNKILLIEDINEENYSIDRMLMQLLLSNKLNTCSGFILGHFTPSNENTEKIILDILKPLNKPIVIGFPSGHDYPNIILPIGAKTFLDIDNNTISFYENLIK